MITEIPARIHICPGCDDITSGPEFCATCRALHASIIARDEQSNPNCSESASPPPRSPTHFVSIDHGSGDSRSAAGLFGVDQNGQVFATAELVENQAPEQQPSPTRWHAAVQISIWSTVSLFWLLALYGAIHLLRLLREWW